MSYRQSIDKARESALLAVEVYNKPAVKFKTGSYVVLMIIAWTSIMHAYYFKRKIKPIYQEKNSKKYKEREDDFAYWDLSKCLTEYGLTEYGEKILKPAIIKNIEFFIKIRNKIEHKQLKEVDPELFGESQALLLNFDYFIEKEFGEKYYIRESLSFAMQLFPSNQSLKNAARHKSKAIDVINFINNYKSSLATEIINSGEYSFKAFLIQVANHDTAEASSVKFINGKTLSDEELKKLTEIAVMTKERRVEVPVANLGKKRPSEVVKEISEYLKTQDIAKYLENIGKKFTQDSHQRCIRHFKIKPEKGHSDPAATNQKYCIYDSAHKDYLYTEDWVSHLKKLLITEDFWLTISRQSSK